MQRLTSKRWRSWLSPSPYPLQRFCYPFTHCRQVDVSLPLLSLFIRCVLSVSNFPNLSFLIMYPKNFSRIFLILSIKIFLLLRCLSAVFICILRMLLQNDIRCRQSGRKFSRLSLTFRRIAITSQFKTLFFAANECFLYFNQFIF